MSADIRMSGLSDFVRETEERCVALDDPQLEGNTFMIGFGKIAVGRAAPSYGADVPGIAGLESNPLDIAVHVSQGDGSIVQAQQIERGGLAAGWKEGAQYPGRIVADAMAGVRGMGADIEMVIIIRTAEIDVHRRCVFNFAIRPATQQVRVITNDDTTGIEAAGEQEVFSLYRRFI